MEGTYTQPVRVERDGRLVAFAGEVMTMDEAVSRGLVKPEKPAAKRTGRGKKEEQSAEEAPAEDTEEA